MVKVLPLPGELATASLAAEQAHQLAADRQAEARSAVDASGGAVSLCEGLEDHLLLLLVDTDAGVANGEGHHGRGPDERAPSRRFQPLSATPIWTCTLP